MTVLPRLPRLRVKAMKGSDRKFMPKFTVSGLFYGQVKAKDELSEIELNSIEYQILKAKEYAHSSPTESEMLINEFWSESITQKG